MGSFRWIMGPFLAAALSVTGGCGTQTSSTVRPPVPTASQEDHFQKALGFESQQQWDMAKQEYRAAIKQQPGDSRAYVNLGQLYARDGESARAEDSWRQALRANPADSRALNLLGSVSMRQSKYDQAIAYYRKALQADPNYANAHWNLATAYRSVDMKREAADHYRKYIELAPPDDLDGIVEARRYMDSVNEK
jgi:Tfp pilus assembly protein PilF